MSDNGTGGEVGHAAARGVIGLPRAKQSRPLDRLFLALDHLLCGLVLSERRPALNR